MSELHVPSLRFPEFIGKWKEKSFDSLYPKVRNGFVGTATPFYVEEGVSYLQGKNVKNGRIDKKGLIYINEPFHEKNKKSQLQVNDIVMVQSGHVGECALITEEFMNTNCHALLVSTPIKDVESKFYIYYFYAETGKRIIHKITTGNTIKHILSSDLKTQIVFNPTFEEQQKIASFLTAVDSKIEQLNKKQTLFKDYKKGVMQEIFSQKIRFKADDGSEFSEWEEKKLGEVTYNVSKKNKENISYPVYSINNKVGFVPQGEQFEGMDSEERNYDISLYKIIKEKTFAYNPSRIDVGSLGYSGTLNNIIISSLYVCFKTSDLMDDEFLLQYFKTFEFNKSVLRNAEGGVRNYLFYANFSNIKTKLPSLEEQTKIATFLTSIDTKIDQNNEQLEQVKLFKKALLQQMFV